MSDNRSYPWEARCFITATTVSSIMAAATMNKTRFQSAELRAYNMQYIFPIRGSICCATIRLNELLAAGFSSLNLEGCFSFYI